MKNSSLFLILIISMLSFSCSKKEGTTSAKLKLNLSGIVNIASGIGSGGAILFGKNSNGDMFGKKINSAEENLDIPNGSWTFYAMMWDTTGSAPVMNGKVHCGKTATQLNGTAATIAMTLNNANCTDPEYSGGKVYVSAGENRFADIFIEECDEINAATPFSCGFKNQGSALSYRFVFNSFKKNAAGGMILDGESLVSDCKMIDTTASAPNIYYSGLPVNFPSGSGVSPFIGSIEFFMGNVNCTPDAKGVHRFTLHQGVGNATSPEHHVLVSDKTCTPNSSDLISGDAIVRKNKCDMYFGSWDGTNCSGTFLPVIERFAHAGVCSGSQVNANIAIKHQFVLPRPALCAPYINNSSQVGSGHPFSGGQGSEIRPYKICTEWQMNQIGETGSPGFNSTHFKLMNDLDMNKADFGPYAKPSCAGVPGSLVDGHHNLNPLIRITDGPCNTEFSAVDFNGTFDGNNKTIRNGRIQGKTVNYVGFTRKLGGSGKIRNLNFENLEVEGNMYMGGLSGTISAGAEVSNVKIKDGEIKSETTHAGAVTGLLSSSAKVDLVRVVGTELRAKDILGGLVGFNQGTISRSMFNGHIDQNNNMASTSVGGIVGTQTATGTITTIFSEGTLISSAQFSGGIVGTNNSGMINHAYSTMFITSSYTGANSAVGGIVGTNSNTGIQNLYSDSILEYTGGGTTPAKDGIVAAGGNMPSNTASCRSTSPTTTSSCNSGVSATFAEIHGGNNYWPSAEWISNIDGTLPRFTWEQELGLRPCLQSQNLDTVANQIATGRGTSGLPIMICKSSQLKDLVAGDKYYKLAEDISIADWINTDMIASFTGVLDGGGNSVYGLNLTSSTTYPHGIFRVNSGTIKNLKLSGNKIVYTGTSESGVLTGFNGGSIYDVTMTGNSIDGLDQVGSVAGRNGGTINQVRAQAGLIRGQSLVGGIVGANPGIVSKAVSKVDVRDLAAYPGYYKFGGVAGANTGTIDQTVFEGRMEFVNQQTSGAEATVYIGGLVGYNNRYVRNSVTENYSVVKTKNYNAVGGLVGYNDTSGAISTSMSLGSLIYDNGGSAIPVTPGLRTFHQLIGSNFGAYDWNNTFFLEKRAGALIASATASSCTAGAVTFSGSPANLTSANATTDMFMNRNLGGGGNNNLTNYFSYAPPASNYVVASPANCTGGDTFDLFKSYQPNSSGLLSIAGFANINNYSEFDIAYSDSGTPANSTRQADLYEYFVATMENRAPTRPVPIWELEAGDARPKLIQIDH